jgi:hypothetical protein
MFSDNDVDTNHISNFQLSSIFENFNRKGNISNDKYGYANFYIITNKRNLIFPQRFYLSNEEFKKHVIIIYVNDESVKIFLE